MTTRRTTRRSRSRKPVIAALALVVIAALGTGAFLVLRERSSGGWPPAAATTHQITCGAPMPEVADPEGDADVHLRGTLAGSETATGTDGDGGRLVELALLSVNGALVIGADAGLPARQAMPPVVVLVDAAGVVVGGAPEGTVLDPEGSAQPTAEPALPVASVMDASTETLLYACTPDGTAGRPLAPGAYRVYLVQTFLPVDADGEPVAGGEPLTVVSEPMPLTIAAAEEGSESSVTLPLGSLEISALGLDSLQIGSAPPATPAAGDIVVWDETRCGDDDAGGRWVPAYVDRPGPDGALREPFEVWTNDGVISQIAVRTPGPRTPAGIQVGDTLDSLQVAYPNVSNVLRHAAPTEPGLWAVGSETSFLLFEIGPTEAGPGWEPPLLGRILAISAGSADLPLLLAWDEDTCTTPPPNATPPPIRART